MSKTRYHFVMATVFDNDRQLTLTLDDAVRAAADKKAPGTVWMKRAGHWRIVGNFDGKGGVFNGQAQVVPARGSDWRWLAENAT